MYTRTIRKDKKDKWQELLGEIDNDTWGLVYKIAFKKLRSITLVKLDEKDVGKQIRKFFSTHYNATWPHRDIHAKETPLLAEAEVKEAMQRGNIPQRMEKGKGDVDREIETIGRWRKKIQTHLFALCFREITGNTK